MDRGTAHARTTRKRRGFTSEIIHIRLLFCKFEPFGGIGGAALFTKYLVVVADVDVHNTSEVLFRLCANTDPQRDSIFTKGPADVLDHATSEIAMGTKLGIDATRKLVGEGFKRPWPPLIRMSEEVRRKIDALFGK
jgi:4-hydroxy-3-polyprenylbenzoate decarboxylase